MRDPVTRTLSPWQPESRTYACLSATPQFYQRTSLQSHLEGLDLKCQLVPSIWLMININLF